MRELLKMALDALESADAGLCALLISHPMRKQNDRAIDALRAALAQKEAEPVAICADDAGRVIWFVRPEARMPLYATPPAQPAPAVPAVPAVPAAPAVPADWVMVPREPTVEMIDAADESDKAYSLRTLGVGVVLAQSGYDHWVEMIAAAPGSAPAAPAVREPLTDEQVAEACGWKAEMGCKPLPRELRIARAVERAHGIGRTA